MNEQELNKKLAEWAGLVENRYTHDWFVEGFEAHSVNIGKLPNFTQSLDACFKWLWRKAIQTLADIDLSSIEEAIHKLFYLWATERVIRLNDEPALALCLAIEKLIDKEVK